MKNLNPIYIIHENWLWNGIKSAGGYIRDGSVNAFHHAKNTAKGYGSLVGIGQNSSQIRRTAFRDAASGIMSNIIPGAIMGSIYHIAKTWLFSPTKQKCLSDLRKQYNLSNNEEEKRQILSAIEDIKNMTPIQFKMKKVLDPKDVFKSAAIGAALSSLKAIPNAATAIHKDNDPYYVQKSLDGIQASMHQMNRNRTIYGNNPIF